RSSRHCAARSPPTARGRRRRQRRPGSISTRWCGAKGESEDQAMALIEELGSGFADKVRSAQSTFRAVMDAMARPGTVQRITAWLDAPKPLTSPAAAIALTLFDHDTTIWLDEPLSAASHVARWLRFHTSAPITAERRYATYALIGDPLALPDLETFALGSEEYPDRSTT